jgi:hypothetical protein
MTLITLHLSPHITASEAEVTSDRLDGKSLLSVASVKKPEHQGDYDKYQPFACRASSPPVSYWGPPSNWVGAKFSVAKLFERSPGYVSLGREETAP